MFALCWASVKIRCVGYRRIVSQIIKVLIFLHKYIIRLIKIKCGLTGVFTCNGLLYIHVVCMILFAIPPKTWTEMQPWHWYTYPTQSHIHVLALNVFFLNVKQYHHLIPFLQHSFPGIHITITHEVVMYIVIRCSYSNSSFSGHPIFVGITICNTI